MKAPTEEQIRRRAYEIYMKRGEPGRDAENWLQAERELNQMPKSEARTTDWERKSSRRGRDVKRVTIVDSERHRESQKGKLLKVGQQDEH